MYKIIDIISVKRFKNKVMAHLECCSHLRWSLCPLYIAQSRLWWPVQWSAVWPGILWAQKSSKNCSDEPDMDSENPATGSLLCVRGWLLDHHLLPDNKRGKSIVYHIHNWLCKNCFLKKGRQDQLLDQLALLQGLELGGDPLGELPTWSQRLAKQ